MSSRPPIVSVCIPAYRQPEFFRRALRSVLDQDFGDFEVVVTDDSDDESVRRVVAEFPGQTKIRYQRNPRRLGSPENWNAAVDLAAGKYVKILHHDDWLAGPSSLGRFVEMMEAEPGTRFGFSASQVCDANQNPVGVHRPTPDQVRRLREEPEHLFLGNFVGAPSATIYRRADSPRFDPKLKWFVDIEFYIRLLRPAPDGAPSAIAYCPTALVCTTDGAPHQVTAQCMNNARVEVFEGLYLYRNLRPSRADLLKRLRFVWGLLSRYDVRSARDLYEFGLEPPLPASVRLLLAAQRLRRWGRRSRRWMRPGDGVPGVPGVPAAKRAPS